MDWNKAMKQWIANEKRKQDNLAEETIREYKLAEAIRKSELRGIAADGTN